MLERVNDCSFLIIADLRKLSTSYYAQKVLQFCNSVKINRKCLKFFLWFILNILLATEMPCNKNFFCACAGGHQNASYFYTRFNSERLLHFM